MVKNLFWHNLHKCYVQRTRNLHMSIPAKMWILSNFLSEMFLLQMIWFFTQTLFIHLCDISVLCKKKLDLDSIELVKVELLH